MMAANYPMDIAMTRGVSDTLPTHLPARYRRGVLWDLDRRSEIAREVTADLIELSQDVGGWDALSTQQRILCERIVFMRRRALEFESAIMTGRDPPFEHGAYSNICNVLAGYLKALGLKRQARPVESLREIQAAAEAEERREAAARERAGAQEAEPSGPDGAELAEPAEDAL